MNRPNEFASSGHPSGDGANVWQPATMLDSIHAVKTDSGRAVKYPGMQTNIIKVFSVICIMMGVASVVVQIVALVLYVAKMDGLVYFSGDVAGAGIWAGSFHIAAGSLGIASTQKRTKSLLTWTVVMSGIAIFSSLIASTLSGKAVSDGVDYYACYYNPGGKNSDTCDAWISLEWALVGISVAASVSSIVLIVLTSVPLCCSSQHHNISAIKNNQEMSDGTAMGQQQPVYSSRQQQQQQPQQANNNYQTAYVSQPPQTHSVSIPRAQTMREQMRAPASVAQPQQQQQPKGEYKFNSAGYV